MRKPACYVLIRRSLPKSADSFTVFYADTPANRGFIGSREVTAPEGGRAALWTFGEASIRYYQECPKASPEEQKRVLAVLSSFEGDCRHVLLQRLSYARIRKIWAGL